MYKGLVADHYERLHRLHTALLGNDIQEVTRRLYEEHPSFLGYSSKETHPGMFEAVLILSLFQAGKSPGDKNVHKVYFLAPAPLTDGWVLGEFKAAAKRIFGRLKTGSSVAAVQHVGALFHQVLLGSQVFALPQEPDRWVAFGFSRSDPIPEWMSAKLLDLSRLR